MTATHKVKGWCPGALRPMMSGDGLVVRVRPFGGRLRRAQADGIASLAAAHGNGLLDLSSRGNIQIRGVREDSHAPLIEGLTAMGLIDPTPEIESRRNILVTPFWRPGEDAEVLSALLTEQLALANAPDLPGKFGFAIDTGAEPVLQNASADIRFERDAGGGLMLVADGMAQGRPVTLDTAIEAALSLAHWFIENAGDATRMKQVIADGRIPEGAFIPRQAGRATPKPGYTPHGALVGLAFGQMQVETLSTLAKHGGLRLTPWRLVLVESARQLPDVPGVITDSNNPFLRITACTGAPRCSQGLGDTHKLAQHLAPHLGDHKTLHISGCSKGCAHPRPAPLTITAQTDGFSLIRDGKASDPPQHSGLSADALKDHL